MIHKPWWIESHNRCCSSKKSRGGIVSHGYSMRSLLQIFGVFGVYGSQSYSVRQLLFGSRTRWWLWNYLVRIRKTSSQDWALSPRTKQMWSTVAIRINTYVRVWERRAPLIIIDLPSDSRRNVSRRDSCEIKTTPRCPKEAAINNHSYSFICIRQAPRHEARRVSQWWR